MTFVELKVSIPIEFNPLLVPSQVISFQCQCRSHEVENDKLISLLIVLYFLSKFLSTYPSWGAIHSLQWQSYPWDDGRERQGWRSKETDSTIRRLRETRHQGIQKQEPRTRSIFCERGLQERLQYLHLLSLSLTHNDFHVNSSRGSRSISSAQKRRKDLELLLLLQFIPSLVPLIAWS